MPNKSPNPIRYFAVLLFFAVFMSSCSTKEETQRAIEDDYLSPSLRAEVEALKRAVDEQPTTESTIAQRAEILADWIDAYSLAGGEVGVDQTMDSRMIPMRIPLREPVAPVVDV